MLKHVMSATYLNQRIHDIGVDCHAQYICPYCGKATEHHSFSDSADTIYFKTVAKCTFCGKECMVHNRHPQL